MLKAVRFFFMLKSLWAVLGALLVGAVLITASGSNPIAAYHALYVTYDRSLELKHTNLADVPTLIFANPKDELISIKRLKRWFLRNRLNNWKMIVVEPQPLMASAPQHLLRCWQDPKKGAMPPM